MTFRELCEAMDAAGVEVLVDHRPRITLRDWAGLRELELPAAPSLDRSVACACLSLALTGDGRWPELAALAHAAA